MSLTVSWGAGDAESQPLSTNSGWSALGEWADTLDPHAYRAVVHLWEHGHARDPAALAAQLSMALSHFPPADPTVRDTAGGLLRAAHAADAAGADHVAVGNGMGPDAGEDEWDEEAAHFDPPETATESVADVMRVLEHAAQPPHPGLVFNETSHRWENPETGEEHPSDPNHPHAEHAAATKMHDAQGAEEKGRFAAVKGAVAETLSKTRGGRAVLAMGRGGAWLFHHIEKRLLFAMHKTEAVAVQAAKERGLPDERVAKLKRALFIADFIGGYATGGAALAIAGPYAAKVASVMPSLSVAYLAYSTAKNPLATWRAAKRVVADTFAKGSAVAHESAGEPDLAGLLADRLRAAADPEWYLAIFHAALASTGGDAAKAVALADAAVRAQPNGPDDE